MRGACGTQAQTRIHSLGKSNQSGIIRRVDVFACSKPTLRARTPAWRHAKRPGPQFMGGITDALLGIDHHRGYQGVVADGQTPLANGKRPFTGWTTTTTHSRPNLNRQAKQAKSVPDSSLGV